MISLNTSPSLGSMVLTRDASWRMTYTLPQGMEFPDGTEARVLVTDRDSAELEEFEGTVGTTQVVFQADAGRHNHIPAGANFEMFIDLPDRTVKVLYGRVVRRDPSFPLSPTNTDQFVAKIFSDTFNRNMVGPYWVAKSGRVGMHPLTGVSASTHGMAVRNALNVFGIGLTLWQDAGVLWYAPTRTSEIEVEVGLATQDAWIAGGDGDCCIVLHSNYAMTQWLGVRFRDVGTSTTAQIVRGTSPITYTTLGSAVNIEIKTTGKLYRIRTEKEVVSEGEGEETLATSIKLFYADSDTELLSWIDEDGTLLTGAGYRYLGAMWNGSAIHPGPAMYRFRAEDISA